MNTRPSIRPGRLGHRARLLIAAAGLAAAVNAGATVLLSDNFNTEHGGTGVLNYNSFANWTVTNGTVDLIGNGFFDFYPLNGLYVDLDGSTNAAGLMSSKTSFSLTPGTYTLSFLLGGSQRGDTNTVRFGVGSAFSDSITLASAAPLALVTRTFTVSAATTGNVFFQNNGGDNVGAILDNVQFSTGGGNPVPEPAPVLLLALGALGLAAARRRAP